MSDPLSYTLRLTCGHWVRSSLRNGWCWCPRCGTVHAITDKAFGGSPDE